MSGKLHFISAGAGSGKTYRLTQILYAKLSAGEIRPSGVIATTFTRKAATELRERVRSHLLDQGAYKIANAMGFSISELFEADDIFTDVNTYDKTLMEKLRFLDSLDDNEKKSIYTLIDSLISKKKLKDNLSNLIAS